MFFVLFAFALPVGSAWGQPPAPVVVTFTNQNEALAYEELMNSCGMTENWAEEIYRLRKLELSKEEILKKIVREWRSTFTKNDSIWINNIVNLVYKEKSVRQIKINCRTEKETLHQDTKDLLSTLR